MKIAISTDNNLVSAHFGRCPQFTIVDIENNEVIKKEIIANPGHAPGNIPAFMNNLGTDVIVAGGMGIKAQDLFQNYNIKVVIGVQGNVDDTIKKILDSTLIGGESLCKPGAGKGYGIPKEKDENEN
jgi:predicted Fe-Mo cluster-binding NifX family protein